MTSLTTTLLCAIRYSHFRSLGVYREVQAALVGLWPSLDHEERLWLLNMLREQVVPETARDAEQWGDRLLPVSAPEAFAEARSWKSLLEMLDSRLEEE